MASTSATATTLIDDLIDDLVVEVDEFKRLKIRH